MQQKIKEQLTYLSDGELSLRRDCCRFRLEEYQTESRNRRLAPALRAAALNIQPILRLRITELENEICTREIERRKTTFETLVPSRLRSLGFIGSVIKLHDRMMNHSRARLAAQNAQIDAELNTRSAEYSRLSEILKDSEPNLNCR